MLSSKANFGHDTQAAPPHQVPGRAKQRLVVLAEVPKSPVHTLIPWPYPAPPFPGCTWKASLWYCCGGCPLASNTGNWNSKMHRGWAELLPSWCPGKLGCRWCSAGTPGTVWLHLGTALLGRELHTNSSYCSKTSIASGSKQVSLHSTMCYLRKLALDMNH